MFKYECADEFYILWQVISSPCWRCQSRNVSCQPPRRRTGGGRWSALSCSRSGRRHLESESERETETEGGLKTERKRERDWNTGSYMWEEEEDGHRQTMFNEKMKHGARWRARWKETERFTGQTVMFEHRHAGCIMQREGELTVFGEHHELIRVDHPAGDLQLDSFRFQALQPGQQSPALRETHGNTSAVTWHVCCVFKQDSCVLSLNRGSISSPLCAISMLQFSATAMSSFFC